MEMRVEVNCDNSICKIGRWGAPGLMPEWQKICEAWPVSKGYHPILIETGMGLYYHVPEVNSYNLTRIETMNYSNGHYLSKSTNTQYQNLSKVSALKSIYDQLLLNE